VLDEEDNLVAFAILMPSFSKALQRANGRLFSLWIISLTESEKKNLKTLFFYLIGVHPKYQNKGLTAILFHECWIACNKRGIEKCIRTPELEENIAVKKFMECF
jgi:GNAT superfamily N-acetyltransferase